MLLFFVAFKSQVDSGFPVFLVAQPILRFIYLFFRFLKVKPIQTF
jgi:hypothetical protein